MYPSWGNYSAPPSQNYGGSGPRKPLPGGHTAHPGQPAPGYGGFEAPSSGSLISSLQEQHLQQMQQLQMLHQKQLQSVLHHSNVPSGYGGGYSGPAWQSEGSGHLEGGVGTQSYYNPSDDPASQPARDAPAPQDHPQPPPPPPQLHPKEPQPVPPPPDPPLSKPPENNAAPKEPTKKDLSITEDDKALHLQVTSAYLEMFSMKFI